MIPPLQINGHQIEQTYTFYRIGNVIHKPRNASIEIQLKMHRNVAMKGAYSCHPLRKERGKGLQLLSDSSKGATPELITFACESNSNQSVARFPNSSLSYRDSCWCQNPGWVGGWENKNNSNTLVDYDPDRPPVIPVGVPNLSFSLLLVKQKRLCDIHHAVSQKQESRFGATENSIDYNSVTS